MSGVTDLWLGRGTSITLTAVLSLAMGCDQGSETRSADVLSSVADVGGGNSSGSPGEGRSCSFDSACAIMRCCAGGCGAPGWEDGFNKLCDQRPLDAWRACVCPEGLRPPTYSTEDTEFEHATCPDECEAREEVLSYLLYKLDMDPCGPEPPEEFCAAYGPEVCAKFIQGLQDSGFYAEMERRAPGALTPCSSPDADAASGD